MDSDTRVQAQEIVRRLCVGRSICGVHFYADQPILVLSSYDGSSTVDFEGPAEAYLTIEGGWAVPADLSTALGSVEVSPAARTIEDLAILASSLRKSPITLAHIGATVPHLGLQFADGRTLLVNGWDPRFETWSIGAGEWSIYALQNGKITWAAKHPAFV